MLEGRIGSEFDRAVVDPNRPAETSDCDGRVRRYPRIPVPAECATPTAHSSRVTCVGTAEMTRRAEAGQSRLAAHRDAEAPLAATDDASI